MSKPDLDDYRIIHHTLRAGAHQMAAALAACEECSGTQAKALVKYWTGYAGEVFAHHTIEDDIFFPRLVERVPAAVDLLEQAAADHHQLDRLMGACHRSLTELTRATTAAAAFEAAACMRELASHMDSHLDFEDEHIVPLFGDHFTAEEYAELTTAAMKHLGIGKQAAFTVPFVMHWAAPADAAKMLGEAPAAFRLLFHVTRRGHARLVHRALGAAAVAPAVRS
jgi:hemerythrin-like domain-containing protein